MTKLRIKNELLKKKKKKKINFADFDFFSARLFFR